MNAADLLARYADRRDAEAFALLVSEFQSMVLATCRRRVRSPADVDDAVQETFLKLAKNAGTLRTNVAAWLHRCAINVSADINRRGETRRRHEALLASAEVGVDEDPQRELAELREHLDAALEKLDEPTRDLILQRFFVGRSQVDIAKEAGVTPSAISQRLDRAVEALRAHLAASGAIVAGGAGLVAMLSAEQASAAVVSPALTANLNAIGLAGTPPATAGAAGGTLGIWAAIAAALALLVAAVGATFWFRAQATSPAVNVAAVDAPAATTQAAGSLTVRSGEEAAPTPAGPDWAAKAAPASGVLSGRITDAEGRPIAGAQVVLTNVRTGPARTDADGRYSFATVPRDGEYRMAVTAEGFAPIWGDYGDRAATLRLAAGAQAQRDVVLRRAVNVTLVIEDVAGEPLQEPRVSYLPIVAGNDPRVAERHDAVNAEGIATIPLPVGDTPYAVLISAKGRAPQFVTVTPKNADEPINLPITLDRGVTVNGTAICSDGKPGTGWSIMVRPVGWPGNGYPYRDAKIDADGKFSVPNVVPGAYDVSFSIPMGEGMSSSRPLGRMELSADAPLALAIPMKSPASLTRIAGTVKWVGDIEGSPHVSIDARSRTDDNAWHHGSVRYNPTKGRDGTFTVENVEPGEYDIRFESSTIAPVKLERVKVPGELPTVELRVAKKSRLAGVVTDAETGKPVASFAYRLRKLQTIGDGPNYVPDEDWVQVADKDGAFTAELVGPGEYQAQISAAGYVWTWSPSARVETLGADGMTEVKLSRGGTVRGVVQDAAGKPVAGAKVVPFSKAQALDARPGDGRKQFVGDAGAVLTDAEGRYELKNLAPGGDALRVSYADASPVQVDVAVAAGETRDAPPITLGAGASIAGVVYDADGKPAANTTVEFHDRSGYRGTSEREAGRVAHATTDAQGRYRVSGLPDGMMLYANAADGWQRGGVMRQVVRAVAGRPATLDFGGANVVTGRLLKSDRTPPTGDVLLRLSTGDPNFGVVLAVAKPDADGRFNLGGVPAGRYQLYVASRLSDDRMPIRDVTVADAPLDLGDVVNDRGRVTLTIAAEETADVAANVALVTDPNLFNHDMPVARFREENGRWICDDVPAGRTVAKAWTKDHKLLGTVAIDRTAGQAELSVTLAVPRRTGTLHVVPPAEPNKTLARVIDANGTSWTWLGWPNESTIAVPPGTYRITAAFTQRPREGVPPIVVAAGQTVDVTLPMEDAPVTADVYVWTANGALVTDAQVTLVDSAGKAIEPVPQIGAERATFPVPPGRYTARVKRPGAAAADCAIEVGWPALTTWTSPVACHAVLPE